MGWLSLGGAIYRAPTVLITQKYSDRIKNSKRFFRTGGICDSWHKLRYSQLDIAFVKLESKLKITIMLDNLNFTKSVKIFELWVFFVSMFEKICSLFCYRHLSTEPMYFYVYIWQLTYNYCRDLSFPSVRNVISISKCHK